MNILQGWKHLVSHEMIHWNKVWFHYYKNFQVSKMVKSKNSSKLFKLKFCKNLSLSKRHGLFISLLARWFFFVNFVWQGLNFFVKFWMLPNHHAFNIISIKNIVPKYFWLITNSQNSKHLLNTNKRAKGCFISIQRLTLKKLNRH